MVHEYISELEVLYEKEEAEQLIYWLTEAFFGVSRTHLALNPKKRLSESEMLKLHFAVKELNKFKPVQYIVGEIPFLDLTLKVSPAVLIPRPETEQLVDWILHVEKDENLFVLDAGTGSGCIALALKQGMDKASVWAYDQSEDALEVARQNSELNGQQVVFFKADMLLEIDDNLLTFDIVVSNPPYVLHGERIKMLPNVLDYEPDQALFVSDDSPLVFYQGIINQSEHILKRGGRIYFEINEALGQEMVNLLRLSGYKDVQLKCDLNNRHRFISGIKE